MGTAQQMAQEFCEGAFGPFKVELAPYVAIVTELLKTAQAAERERCAQIAEDLGNTKHNAFDQGTSLGIAEAIRLVNG